MIFVPAILPLRTANAQVAGSLTGSVIDQSGAAIPNAKVSLLLPSGKVPVAQTDTTAEGLFRIPAVRPDLYNLDVEAQGFTKATIDHVKIDPAKDNSLPPIVMQVASTAESVDVTAAVGGGVQTASIEIATTVTQSQVQNLPVLDRQVSNLFTTQAGVSSSRTATTIDGLRPSYSNLLLDGVNIQDSVRTNGLDFVPNRLTIGQISEMTISASNSNPTIGGNASTISLSTPSGTNEFHGNAYWYNRNNFFGANDWFNNKNSVDRPFLNLNQLGGAIGGPIIKDKLLFFSNYEAYRLRQTSPQLNTILTPQARQGILQYRDAAGNLQSFDVLKAFNLQIDPYIAGLLQQIPAAGNSNGTGDGLNTTGYAFNGRSNVTRDNVTGKLDYYLSPRHVFSGSYIWNRELVDQPDSGTFYTTIPPVFNDDRARFLSVGWRWSPTATLTNELRGGFNLAPVTFQTRQADPAFFVLNSSLLFTSPVNETRPEGRTTNTYAIQDNGNWVKGRHSLSFGFQANLWRTDLYGYLGSGSSSTIPSYTIGYATSSPYGFNVGDIPGASATDINTANSLLASLAGILNSGQQTFNVTSQTSGFVPGAPSRFQLRMNNYAPYFSDTWKVRRNLTLVLGVRWEYFSPVDDPTGLIIEPHVASGNPVEALLGNATLDFTASSVGRPLYKRDLNNFAPNVGFAWDVFGDGRTAVRAAYGIAYANDNIINSIYDTVSVNNGISSTIVVNDVEGRVTGALPSISVPPFKVPTTSEEQFNLSQSSAPVQGLVDPNLAIPYVQQWNFGIEHSFKGFVVSGRYVGNHVVKQFRQIDFNQINVKQGGFLDDFSRARNNGFLAQRATGSFNPNYNPAIAGSQPLPFFDQLPAGGALTAPPVASLISSGQVGTLGQLYQGAGFFPNNSFSYFPNPFTLYSSMLTNLSNSSYNSAQFEITKRTTSGMQFQANYVFSKALSDADAFRGLEAQLDNNNPAIERARAPYDLTHAFKLNHYFPLPFGPGHRFGPQSGFLRRVAEGWGIAGIAIIQSGSPVSILSARGTLNRSARSGSNTVDTTLNLDQLQAATGLFMTPNGPYFVDPSHIGQDGRGVAPDGAAPFPGQIFFNPQPGTVGSLQKRILDGPWYKNYNLSIQKDTKITERQSIQFRADFFNVFNHANFWPGPNSATADQNVNDPNFGKITSQFYSVDGVGPRVLQFGLFYRF
jgi:hypothetical protein